MTKRENFRSVFFKRLPIIMIAMFVAFLITFVTLDFIERRKFIEEVQLTSTACGMGIDSTLEYADGTQAKINRSRQVVCNTADDLKMRGIKSYIKVRHKGTDICDSSEVVRVWIPFSLEAGDDFYCDNPEIIDYFKERMAEAEKTANGRFYTTFFIWDDIYFINQSEFTTPMVRAVTTITEADGSKLEYEDTREFETKPKDEYFHTAFRKWNPDDPRYGYQSGEMTLIGVDETEFIEPSEYEFNGHKFEVYKYLKQGIPFHSVYTYGYVTEKGTEIQICATCNRLWGNGIKYLIIFGLYIIAGFVFSLALARKTYERLKNFYAMEDYRIKLVNSMAHDLKTPITAMIGYADNLTENVHTEKREHYAQAVKENAEYMNSIIGNVLKLSKLEAGCKLNREELDLIELTRKLSVKLEIMCEERNITLDISGKAVKEADAELMCSVIDNLLSNAVNYASENTVVRVTGEGGVYTVENEFDGKIKISADKLWEPFVKGDESRSERRGSGLGLSIVKNILDAHGFKAVLKKEGTRFTVSF